MWEPARKQYKMDKRTIVLIFLFGFLVRVYMAFNTYVVNPNGTIYLHQAEALF